MSDKEEFSPIITNPDGSTEGKKPSLLSKDNFEALGHGKLSPLKAIRAHCVECSGDSPAEARMCVTATCPLWPYRLGKNPFRAPRKMSEAQLAALAKGRGA